MLNESPSSRYALPTRAGYLSRRNCGACAAGYACTVLIFCRSYIFLYSFFLILLLSPFLSFFISSYISLSSSLLSHFLPLFLPFILSFSILSASLSFFFPSPFFASSYLSFSLSSFLSKNRGSYIVSSSVT